MPLIDFTHVQRLTIFFCSLKVPAKILCDFHSLSATRDRVLGHFRVVGKLYYKGPIKQRGLITKPEKKCQKKKGNSFVHDRAKWDLGRATSDVTSGTKLKHSRDF